MGTYYMAACDEAKERIDPGSINDLGVKFGSISHPEHPFGSVVIFAMATRWRGKQARIASDIGSDPGYYDYREVTAEVLAEYNRVHRTDLRFTGDD